MAPTPNTVRGRRPRFQHGRAGGLGPVRSANPVRPGNMLRLPETSTESGTALAGGKAAAAAHPGYVGGQTTPLPPDSAYTAQTEAIGDSRDETVAGLRGERGRYLQDAGYRAQFDAQDRYVPGSMQFDATNVFSRAALLLKKYRESRTQNVNSLASMGQLNSGAAGRQQRFINFNESQSQDAQQKAVIDFLARNSGQIAKAGTDAEFALGVAEGQRIDRAQSNPLYDPTTPAVQPQAPAPPAGVQYDQYGRLITAAGNGRPSVVYDPVKKGYWHYYTDGRKPVFVKK